MHRPMTKSSLALFTIFSLMLFGCAGSKREDDGTRVKPEKVRLIEVLTLFVEAVQEDRFDKAFNFLTPEEQNKMTEGSGKMSPVTCRRLKAMRLSTIAQKMGVRLENDKLSGLYQWLPNLEATPAPVPVAQDLPLLQ